MKAIGNRVILKVKKIQKVNPENGEKYWDFDRKGKVVQSGNKEIKKGDEVYYNPFGSVNLEELETKNALVMCVDFEDIYVKL